MVAKEGKLAAAEDITDLDITSQTKRNWERQTGTLITTPKVFM